ncbi:MAG: FliH/SctL family protein [Acidobacteriaceae bacterium]
MSSSWVGNGGLAAVPVTTLMYLDMASGQSLAGTGAQADGEDSGAEAGPQHAEVELSHIEFRRLIEQERADAAQQAEERLRGEYERDLLAEGSSVAAALAEFGLQRDQYFVRAEAEVVQLALSIAAKILHREAQVDPMLVATLVRMAVDKIREGSSVTVRVGSGQAARWKDCLDGQTNKVPLEVVEDAMLTDHDCLVETELGVANFGLDTQLKEVEQGFFDLMALRPGIQGLENPRLEKA